MPSVPHSVPEPDPQRGPGAAPARVDPLVFREVVGRFPTGVTVVTAVSADGEHRAMTANSFTSVSLDPVLALVCVDRTARFHDVVCDAGTWGVSVLADDQEEVSRWFATRGRESGSEYENFAHHRGPATGAVLLDGALATFECRTVAAHPGGDHTVLVGEVLSLGVPRRDAGPLLFYEGGYRALLA